MEPIYLDHASAMPIDPRVMEFAGNMLSGDLGNPSSLHSRGMGSRRALNQARAKVADLINAEKEESVLFTSGATEANNLAIRGTALRNRGKGKEVLASEIEHISVLNPMKDLQKAGFQFTRIPVDEKGVVLLDELEQALTGETVVTSIMYANNEIGTVQPIRDISEMVHDRGIYLHVDATAAAGRIPIDVQEDGIDLLTLSSNDLYGPQGAGALYIRPGTRVQPILVGGGQERGLRPGTENIFAIAGMGEASRIVRDEMVEESERLRGIRDRIIEETLQMEESRLTGHPSERLPHHASFIFSRIEGESILMNMEMYGIQVATGSACSSKTLEPSHVLMALGLRHEEAHGSMILTLGRSNTMEQVPRIMESTRETVKRLRGMSPL